MNESRKTAETLRELLALGLTEDAKNEIIEWCKEESGHTAGKDDIDIVCDEMDVYEAFPEGVKNAKCM